MSFVSVRNYTLILPATPIMFQVTGNSVMERKNHLDIGDNKVIFVFGGAGWLERFGCTNIEFGKLKDFFIKFAEKNCPLVKKQKSITDFK